MRTRLLFMLLLTGWAWGTAQAATDEGRYIEVTGTSEVEIVPDEIHYIIEIKEYFAEEFDGKSKEEDYRTKVPLARIEEGLRETLREAGVPNDAVRTQEIGDYWRESGREFLVSKRFDLTLTDFKQIDRIVRHVDTKGIHTMRIGELKNKDMQLYHQKGKIAALMAAREKAAYLVEALGQKLGGVERIIENGNNGFSPVFTAQSNVSSSDAASFDGFRTIKNHYFMSVRFEILDK